MKIKDYMILLAEDNDELYNRFIMLLNGKGCVVIASKTGEGLYRQVKAYSDRLEELIVVSDTDLPDTNGDQVCRRLLEQDPMYKKLLIFGMSDNPDNERYWEGVGIINSFIYKGTDIASFNSRKNIAELVEARLNEILGNPSVFRLQDGSYRRSVR